MKLKSSCCKSYKKKGKACKNCPTFAVMPKKKRRRKLRKFKR